MAAKKRKIAQPKPTAEGEGELAADAIEVQATEVEATEVQAIEVEPAGVAVAALEVEIETETEPEPLSSADPDSALDPASEPLADSDQPEPGPDAERPELDANAETEAEVTALEEALLGEGPSDVDESRVDDTGAYLKGLLEALLFVSD